jgi:imidazolonepropionase-like amidohydrolase
MRSSLMKPMLLTCTTILLAATGVLSAQETITIKAARVLDGRGATLTNAAVVVQGSKIVGIERNPTRVTYDLGDMTLMPGWIDTHVHIASHFDRDTGRMHSAQSKPETREEATMYLVENAYNVLMSGFTTVQSPGAEIDKYLREWTSDGSVPGPRVLTSLRSVNERTGTPEQIRAFVRKVVADGADFVKVFATKSIREGGAQTMTDEQLQAACGEAKTLGKRAIVHAQGPEGAKASVLAGCTAIEHGNRLTDEVLDLMVAHGTYFDSNNHLLLHNYIDNKPHYLGIGNYNDEGFVYLEKGLAIGNDTFKRALKKHVKMVFGTDGMPGAIGREYEELIYRVNDGGQAPMDAIVSATSASAESIGLGAMIGAIVSGMEADIIATAGNPLEDIAAVRNVAFVMKGGKVYKYVAPSAASSAMTMATSKE